MPVELVKRDLVSLTRVSLQDLVALQGERLRLDLPTEPKLVCCDVNLTTRVITNLVGNALKFTPEPGEVIVRIDLAEQNVRLSVTDRGPGIAADQHASIFEKFGQVKGSRTEHSTGLGLTFCKLAVAAQAGEIGVESKVDAGSTFWFALPSACAGG